jgi:hypothetical protein
MNDGRLPQELVDAVIDNLHEDDDFDAVFACSLVCRKWVSSAQRHIFEVVIFNLDTDACKPLAQGLLDSPHLLGYIQHLCVSMCTHDAEDLTRAYEAIDQSLSVKVLTKIRELSNLKSISITNLDLGRLTVDLCQSLREVLLLPSLTSLELAVVAFERISLVSLTFHAEI